MKRIIALLLALLMVFALVACAAKEESKPADDKTDAPAASDDGGDAPAASDEPYEIVYLAPSFGVEWCVDVRDNLMLFEDEYNIKILSGDSDNNNDKYLTQVETYCGQGVDGFIIMCYNEIAEPVLDTIREYNIPVVFDSIKLTDQDGNLLVNGVELNGYDCGYKCGEWLGQNYKSYLGEDVSMDTLGLIVVTMSSVSNLTARAEGAVDSLEAAFPNVPIITADLVAQGEGNSTTAYNEVAPKLSANPDIEHWLIIGVQDTYGQGAARAVESLGLDDVTLVVSAGGENLIPEWEVGYEGCWVACNVFSAYTYCEYFVPGIISLIEGTATEADLWPEWKEGDTYSSVQISGSMATKDNYTDFLPKQ